jgi:hypothetical protein
VDRSRRTPDSTEEDSDVDLSEQAEGVAQEADGSKELLDQMVDGGGPASDEEAFAFNAEMIGRLTDQLQSVSELLAQLTERVERLEA